MNSILISDASPLVCKGLQQIIRSRENWEICEILMNPTLLSRSLDHHHPDLLLTECPDSNFLKTLIQWKESHQAKHILVMSSQMENRLLKEIYSSSLNGFLFKEDNISEVLFAIDQCLKGERFFSRLGLEYMFRQDTLTKDLTSREMEILGLVAKGMSTKDIASTLCLSIHTINSHRKNIIRKLDINSPMEFVHHALTRNLI